MKVWAMKDLGLQAVQAILQSKTPLKKLTDICQNFPAYAPSLSAIKARYVLLLSATA
jgi:hypothetical protein